MSRVLLVLYSLLGALLLVPAAPWWLWQMARTGKYREGLLERLGRAPARLQPAPARLARSPGQRTIWVHAVSVGEVLAVGRLVTDLEQALPGAAVYVSTTTRTGQALAREHFGAGRVFYFPLDFAFAMRAWLRFLRPALVVLVESEFWPRMLVECRRAGVPVAVVNARVSDRSWPRYQGLRWLWRPLLGSLALVLAQSERDAERLRWLGAAAATSTGNLKYDIRVTAPAAITGVLRVRLADGVPVVVCGSTLGGEEELLLDSLPLGEVVTVLAPRHPERFEEVARLLAARGVPYVRRSAWAAGGTAALGTLAPPGLAGDAAAAGTIVPGTVVLLDSVGELASVYSLATLAVAGGGFLWPGGHNPLEPAQFGVPVLMGSHYANFREVVEALLADQAVALSDAPSLQEALRRLLSDRDGLRAMGERGRRVFERQAGATGVTVTKLAQLVAPPAVPPAHAAWLDDRLSGSVTGAESGREISR